MNSRASRRILRKRKLRLEREAMRFAAEAQLFADRVMLGGPYSGDFTSLMRSAFRVIALAARLDGMTEAFEQNEEDE